jgi:hypothetical protein
MIVYGVATVFTSIPTRLKNDAGRIVIVTPPPRSSAE